MAIDLVEQDVPVLVYSAHGHVHAGVEHRGSILTSESCNVDDMGPVRVVARSWDKVPADIPTCDRCFPEGRPE